MIKKVTRTALLLIFSMLTLSHSVRVKPITVFVEDMLGTSEFTGEVVVTGYDDSGYVHFKPITLDDTITKAYCDNPFKTGFTWPHDPKSNNWTNNYPYAGDTVFIAVQSNSIMFFGKRVGNDYRLWTHYSGGSISIFVFRKPIRCIDTATCTDMYRNYESCWDGCLIPIDIAQSLVLEYRQKFKNKLASIQLSNFVEKPAYEVLYNDTLKHYKKLNWNNGSRKKLLSLTVTYTTGRSLEITPVDDRNKPIRFDTEKRIDWNKFYKLKVKQIRWLQ